MLKRLLTRRSSKRASSIYEPSPTIANLDQPGPNLNPSFASSYGQPSESKEGKTALPPPPPYQDGNAVGGGSLAVPPSGGGVGGAGGGSAARTSIAAARSASSLQDGQEDPFDFLRSYDTVFLVDDSGSMAGSRWGEARDALASVVATASKYDDDGIDIHFLNSKTVGSGMKNASQVLALFNRVTPRGGTPTGTRLEALLLAHLDALESEKRRGGAGASKIKPLNIVVLTDGEPSDDPRSVIIQAAKRLDRGDFPLSAVGIFFLQIGNDPAATEALAELDDDLGADIRDIVDTAAYAPGRSQERGWVEKILMGGINRRIDRKAVR